MSTLKTLLEDVNASHAEQPANAGERLMQGHGALLAGATTEELVELVRVGEHVLLGHLADARRLADLLQRLQERPSADAESSLALLVPVQRSRAAIALHDGATPALEGLPAAERVRSHYNPALAATRSADWPRVRALVAAAEAQAAAAVQDGAAQKAIAALTNNLAADLRYYFGRQTDGDIARARVMIQAAERARGHWGRAGGWLEVERAHWQLAMCHAAAGEGAPALAHARRTLAACASHDADDFECCFAHEAMGRAAVAAGDRGLAAESLRKMSGHADRMTDESDRAYAQGCIRELTRLLQAA